MAKFILKAFVMKTLTSMKEAGEDEYKVMQYALKYYEKKRADRRRPCRSRKLVRYRRRCRR